MSHPCLVELLFAASVSSVVLLLGTPAKHMLTFLGAPDAVDCIFDLQCEDSFKTTCA